MKTDLTKYLEKLIYQATVRQGVFGCFEVTIGWFGAERVDYLTYDCKGVWHCYEVKVSKSDFHFSETFYLQKFEHFTPYHASDAEIAGYLMELKKKLQKGNKNEKQIT